MALAERFISCCCRSRTNSLLLFSRGFSAKLFVKGVAFSTTDDALAEAFSEFGRVLETKIIMNKVKNRSKVFLLKMKAQIALQKMNGKLLHGRAIFVDNARTANYNVTAKGRPEPTE